MESPPARFLLLGASHHATPLAIRERLAVPAERMAALYQTIRSIAGIRETLVLTTCNRLEIYSVATAGNADPGIGDALCNFQKFPPTEFTHHRFVLRDADAIQHLLEVACGADSQIVGETEIFGQVKAAYATACAQSSAGPVLNRVFQKAFQAAKFIRNHTPIGDGQVSVATVAVDLAGKIYGNLEQCRVLVLGTGEVGEKTAKALVSRGVRSITVLSRTQARAETLAATVGATAGTLDMLGERLPESDIVIGSTGAPAPVITAHAVHDALRGSRSRGMKPLFLIDLAIPRNFEPASGELDSVFLYDLDDLARIADENLATRRAAVDRCRDLAREKAVRIWEGVAPRLEETNSLVESRGLAPRAQVT